MSRLHPAAKAAAAARYIPSLADTLIPLAEEVGKVVVKDLKAPAAKGAKTGAGGVVIRIELTKLEAHISGLLAEALNRSLSSPTEAGKALRMELIARLATTEIGQDAPGMVVAAPSVDALLTTAEAAAKLEVSRPYVSMLCDAGKLGEVVMTEGGHRRIRSSAVAAYLAAMTRPHDTAVTPRQAGVDAGLYDRPDEEFVNVVRGGSTKPKAARKPRE